MIGRGQITLGILAGGRALRLGGVDKAFAEYRGQSLLARTLDAMGEGFCETLVSHPGNEPRLARMPLRTVPDRRADFPGPLAGIEAMLHAARSPWLLTLPVDVRDIPPGLCQSLCEAAIGPGVVIQDAQGLQPIVGLWRVDAVRPTVTAALDSGQLAAHRLVSMLGLKIHDISPLRLGNLNTPADFEPMDNQPMDSQ